jgi:hypothetical protein
MYSDFVDLVTVLQCAKWREFLTLESLRSIPVGVSGTLKKVVGLSMGQYEALTGSILTMGGDWI